MSRNKNKRQTAAKHITNAPTVIVELPSPIAIPEGLTSLQALDYVVTEMGSSQSEKRCEQLRAAAYYQVLAVAHYSELDSVDSIDDETFSTALDNAVIKGTKTVASCLLRMISEPSMSTRMFDAPLRPRVVSMLDTHCATSLYPVLHVDKNAQSHEKLPQIATAVRDHENKFRAALELLTSLDQTGSQRSSVMKSLRGNAGDMLFAPFLPRDVEGSLNELYTRVNSYSMTRETPEAMNGYITVTEAIDTFIESLNAHRTVYSAWLAQGVGERLKSMVNADFRESIATKPASIECTIRDRKYPLHLIDQDVRLIFDIENRGSGHAEDIIITLNPGDHYILNDDQQVRISRLAPGESLPTVFSIRMAGAATQIDGIVEIAWRNYDRSEDTSDSYFDAMAQRSNIDWESLKANNPYSLSWIDDERKLIGRDDMKARLISAISQTGVGSAVIKGQKRVGKTSLALTIGAHFRARGDVVISSSAGDYSGGGDAVAAINEMGIYLCQLLRRYKAKDDGGQVVAPLTSLEVPQFAGSISPLSLFLQDTVDALDSEQRIILILDEFDELPFDLLGDTPTANAFFSFIRSISNRKGIGLILVGGERMGYVLDKHGVKLNNFAREPVDYFERDVDYENLVRIPSQDVLDYTPDAVVALHWTTAGNPYFTNAICNRIFHAAVNKKDCYITESEVNAAVDQAVRGESLSLGPLAYFWNDYIFQRDPKDREDISQRRRRILVALSDELRDNKMATPRGIANRLPSDDRRMLDMDLKEFVTRKVLTAKEIVEGDQCLAVYDFKMPLLHLWLKARGIGEIIGTYSTMSKDEFWEQREEEEKLKVTARELKELLDDVWGVRYYKGYPITSQDVTLWLEQFGNLRHQRAMMQILKGTRYFTNGYVSEKLDQIGTRAVYKGIPHRLQEGRRLFTDTIISYLDGPGKSGYELAGLFAEVHRLPRGKENSSVVEKPILEQTLMKRTEINTLVFVDDFVATGNTVAKHLQEMDTTIGDIVKERNIRVVFIAIVALATGWQVVEQAVAALNMEVRPYCCDLLGDADVLFSETSRTFPDPDERQRGKEIAIQYGQKIWPEKPLGYGSLGLSIVFEANCPNNTLPILWKDSMNPPWKPLFRR